jgi:hypothetical protein
MVDQVATTIEIIDGYVLSLAVTGPVYNGDSFFGGRQAEII